MRALLPLLLLLIAFAGVRPACAQASAPCAAMADSAHRGMRHHDCGAACIGCAIPLPDAARPAAVPARLASAAPFADPARPLAGVAPAATSPPPRNLG